MDHDAAQYAHDRVHHQGISRKRTGSAATHLRNHLISTGRFIGVIPSSVVRLNARRFGLVALPIELSAADLSLAVITVKDRTLTPVVKLFLECAREAANSIE